ncbi:geranylgeranyl diphosphate reductase [Candidatus Viridilinea mediisalina]|uniref:Geranylgeranyl diphosphate reductase n=1 Tax=Candidatus Viridilinea mediisalina TaxID=2024553 RepID=A0A2A6RLP3_9CHLR|nr:geranylgeranyl diphosphate reductase [Candidatus Viridilinea mediisalina]PDW03982.1 geranylgeranyl reductase [Candidatus Viridilinea mediisalina]
MAQRVLVVGASVGGAIAAITLRGLGVETVMLEKELVKAKPCGGAIPPVAFTEFDLPQRLIDRKIKYCLMVSPSGQETIVPVAGSVPSDDDYVAMVRREIFDGFLRERAQRRGADLIHGQLLGLEVNHAGVTARYRSMANGQEQTIQAAAVIGADGCYSPTARMLGLPQMPRAVAIQERIALPEAQMARWAETADLYLGSEVSPDLYAWAFPKCDHIALGIGAGPRYTAHAKRLLSNLKTRLGPAITGGQLLLREAHALPMEPRKHMAFERAMLVGDAAGLVVHTSGEGIYWAMKSGQLAAQTLAHFLDVPSAANLRTYERIWWQEYGLMYNFLRWLQWWGYGNERQMEVFTEMCRNADVQRLTFDSYMYKQMAPAPWLVQMRMTKDIIMAQVRNYLQRRTPVRERLGLAEVS